jgi:hypothetical protein
MKKSFLKNLIFTLFLTTTIFLIFINKAYAQEVAISVTPSRIQETVRDPDKLSADFEIITKSLNAAKFDYNYYELDSSLKNPNRSDLFASITYIASDRPDPNTLKLHVEVTTSNLEDKTYFFALEVVFTEGGINNSLNSNVGVGIPFILTVNKDTALDNPKPEFKIDTNRRLFFDQNDIKITASTINQSEKIVGVGGELVVLGNDQYVLYSTTISPSSGFLNPKEVFIKNLNVSHLPKSWVFPYIGKLELSIVATINNQRHITTDKITIWIIPYELIIALVIVFFMLIFIVIRIQKRVKKKL